MSSEAHSLRKWVLNMIRTEVERVIGPRPTDTVHGFLDMSKVQARVQWEQRRNAELDRIVREVIEKWEEL